MARNPRARARSVLLGKPMLALLFAPLFGAAACATPAAPDTRLTAAVTTAIGELGPNARAAVWLSAPGQPPRVALDADTPMPCASSIKAAYLVELFDAFADRLDEPMPGIAAVLADPTHPAVAHLGDAARATARRLLADASVRRVGEAMISGKGVDNLTYNIAANLVTAHFGGPAGLTAKLHARDPSWTGLMVRRYMLADRKVDGDNEATARSLAAVHAMLADGHVTGVDARAVDAARQVLAQPDDDQGRKLFAKGGALDSTPVTRVRAGWREGPQGVEVFAVLLARDEVTAQDGAAAGGTLATAAARIEQLLLRDDS